MKKIKNISLFFLVSFTFILVTGVTALQSQEHEKIVEKVDVKNIEIPVRVFDGKRLVGGLKKEDFVLRVNGEQKQINGFYQLRKKLRDNSTKNLDAAQESPQKILPRLFVLVFNLSSFDQDLTSQLDVLFTRIIKPSDRLMVITNRFFLPEWEVKDISASKQRILKTLAKEVKTLKLELLSYETELSALTSYTVSVLSGVEEGADLTEKRQDALRSFFLNYRFALEDIKNKYLNLPVNQYIRIAKYLKSQQVEKWVLNYYQMGRLPMLDSGGQIKKYIDQCLARVKGNKEIKQDIHEYYLNFFLNFQAVDNLFINDIGKAFLNSGATVHTQLLKPADRYFSYEFKYETVNTETESILKKLTHLTGGRVLTSNRTEKFVEKITQEEDILYMITFVPNTHKKRENTKLKIKIKGKDYRVVYDDQKRLKYFANMMEKINAQQPDIEIDSMSLKGDRLVVKLKNIQLMEYEDESLGAVEAHIKIMDRHNRLTKELKKTYKGIKEDGIFQVKLPPLANGEYNIIIEVKDLFSLKQVITGDAISIHRD